MNIEHEANYHFFLGGSDLEMVTICQLLKDCGKYGFTDKKLAWGASFSDYKNEIWAVIKGRQTPVLIELTDDGSLTNEQLEKCILVDHHNKKSGADAKTALEQVHRLLGAAAPTWSRWHSLVSANDRAHIDGLQNEKASPKEILKVRQADRRAQGVTEADERLAQRAIRNREDLPNELTLVNLLGSTKTSPITDMLDERLGGPGYTALLIVCQSEAELEELAFFGSGYIIMQLSRRVPDSWYGGALPDKGFWGCKVGSPIKTEVENAIDWLRSANLSFPNQATLGLPE